MAPDSQAKRKDFQVYLIEEFTPAVAMQKPFFLKRDMYKAIRAEVRLGRSV